MPTIIPHPKSSPPSLAFARKSAFRRPHYDCQEQTDALKLIVYLPGVDPAGIDLEVRGPDLIVTAAKSHFVRSNWKAAHLEGIQRDYQLRLRLGFQLDYETLEAELHEGVLAIRIPKKIPAPAAG